MKSIEFIIFLCVCLSVSGQAQQPTEAIIRVGLVADIQYCDCKTAGTRHYGESLTKLQTSISEFNNNPVDFIVDLGDRIDHDYESFKAVESILDQAVAPVIFVPGNHDFSVNDQKKRSVVLKTGYRKGYHTFIRGNWKFIFLNGLNKSIPASRKASLKYLSASHKLKQLRVEGAANAYDWNGGLGRCQTKWLKRELAKAARQKLKILIFCHQPIADGNAHSLWDYDELKENLKHYPGEIYWINGHDHRGGFEQQANLTMITIHGMVEEESNSFAIIEINGDHLLINGYGRQPDLHPGR